MTIKFKLNPIFVKWQEKGGWNFLAGIVLLISIYTWFHFSTLWCLTHFDSIVTSIRFSLKHNLYHNLHSLFLIVVFFFCDIEIIYWAGPTSTWKLISQSKWQWTRTIPDTESWPIGQHFLDISKKWCNAVISVINKWQLLQITLKFFLWHQKSREMTLCGL
jgi:hypothetical protein